MHDHEAILPCFLSRCVLFFFLLHRRIAYHCFTEHVVESVIRSSMHTTPALSSALLVRI